MKYIKAFENINRSIFWLLPTDDRFKDSLEKIGCSEIFIDVLLNKNYKEKYKENYIYILSINTNIIRYDWMPYTQDAKNYLENNGFKFEGNINIPDYELDAEKYNL